MKSSTNQTYKNNSQYGMGYSDAFVKMLKKRTIETHAPFLIPYLKPGMKLLDCGCGPGSMTISLAKYAKNGQVVGVDIEDSQLEIARLDAKEAGIKNVVFQQASVLELPFADNTFDIVFSQGLLSHLQDPIIAVLEQKRVTKAGGIVVARTMYSSGIVYYPKNLLLEEASKFNFQPIQDNGGDPDLGIKLGELFRKAGFGELKHTIFCDTSDAKSLAKDIFAPEVMNREYNKKLLASGKITLEKLQQYQQAWLDFANDSNAFSYCPVGEIIAVKQKL